MRALPLLLLAACTLPEDDLDGDGFTVADGDCDDLDPGVRPDATESYADGIDQDCDGIDPLMRVDGRDHACVLGGSGQIRCSGDNSHGQLDSPDDGRHFVQIAAGDYHTCGLGTDGLVSCWGDDTFGQSSPPVDGPFVSIGADGSYSLGAFDDGGALCWGRCFGREPKNFP